jgi:putative SOS response-associated peptidase YedK
MKKVIRDGHVAVIYSPGFGAGWYTWNQLLDNAEQLIYDPMIVQILEEQSDNWLDQLVEYVTEEYPDAYAGGLDDLCFDWLPVGTRFRITEYDGSESIETEKNIPWMTA